MAGIFGDVLKGFLGSDYLKDYRHANKTFTSAGYANAPRLKYLFHVYFNINTLNIPELKNLFAPRDGGRISVLTKAVELPKYTFDVETLNQYNRKRNIQQKINYEPIVIDFHDDSSDITRSLYYAYYDYYYTDPSKPYTGNPYTPRESLRGTESLSYQDASTYNLNDPGPLKRYSVQGDTSIRDIYAPDRIGGADWGYAAEGASGRADKPVFFKDITIYGFNQKSFVSYQLLNPIITDFQHDRYDYAEGAGTMSNSMTLRYEGVKYGQGAIGEAGVPGFARPEHYDKQPSSLSRPGSNNSFLGQGGVLDAGVGVFEDLSQGNIFGAATKAGRLILNKDNISLKGVKEEVIQETRKVVSQGISSNAVNSIGAFFPSQASRKNQIAKTRNQPIDRTLIHTTVPSTADEQLNSTRRGTG